jgi:hypothetical protein
MKKLAILLVALFTCVGLAMAQDASSSSSGAQSSDQSTTTTTTKHHHKAGKMGGNHLSGKISDDGKTLTTADGKSYTIDNPDAVKGHEGHDVRVSGKVDTANNTVNVSKVSMMKAGKSKKSKASAGGANPS